MNAVTDTAGEIEPPSEQPLLEAATPLQHHKIYAALAGNPADLGISPQFSQVRAQFNVHTFQTLPSTSTKLWEMLAEGATAGTVVIAQQQTAGRGQRGRIWQSSPGGLYLSLALEPDWPVTHIAQLTCMSAWGIAIAFNNLGIPVKIKWPNDLFFEGKKLGGILTETKLSQTSPASSVAKEGANFPSRERPPTVRQAVIGVGINWHNSTPETATTLTKILESLPGNSAKNKINCLEMLSALVLKGILQGYLFQQQVSSQDFMKAYSILLTQLGDVVSLDNDLLNLVIDNNDQLSKRLLDKGGELEKCSGEVVGISEEGYLKVALRDTSANPVNDLEKVSSSTLSSSSANRSLGCVTDILLIKPADAFV
ncbi:MAG: biotin--[acetyl-CoA-carboxylase] ligase [Phormidesmis sp.]